MRCGETPFDEGRMGGEGGGGRGWLLVKIPRDFSCVTIL